MRTVVALEMRQEWRAKVAHLDWPNLGLRFLGWFEDGIQTVAI
jgi:hypothetical protein